MIQNADIAAEVQKLEEARDQLELDDDEDDGDDPEDSDYDPTEELEEKKAKKRKMQTIEVETCSICSKKVVDLAMHIVNMHSKPAVSEKATPKKEIIVDAAVVGGEPAKRPGSPSPALLAMRPRKRAYCKGKYQQIKPVLRYPCDACKFVCKSTDALKKHMIVAHNGNKNTSWMFCGDCEYATRVEEELVNHVKHHQLFKILGVDKEEEDTNMVDEEEEVKAVIAKATKSGLGNYDPVPMNCGDCAFTTHYENELFEHLKAHLRKDANIQVRNFDPNFKQNLEIFSRSRLRTRRRGRRRGRRSRAVWRLAPSMRRTTACTAASAPSPGREIGIIFVITIIIIIQRSARI